MSVGNATILGNYPRTSATITAFNNLTIAAWFKMNVLPSSGHSYFIGLGPDGTHFTDIQIDNTGAMGVLTNGGATGLGVTLVAGDWIYLGVIHNSTTGTVYVSKNNATASTTSFTVDSSSSAVTGVLMANFVGTTEFSAMWCDHFRCWNGVLTTGNLDTERNSDRAVITTNLFRDVHMINTGDMPGMSLTGAVSSGPDDPYITSVTPGSVNVPLMQRPRSKRNGGLSFGLDTKEWY